MDMIDQIGGWKSVSSVGNSYGQGYNLDVIKMTMAMNGKMVFNTKRLS